MSTFVLILALRLTHTTRPLASSKCRYINWSFDLQCILVGETKSFKRKKNHSSCFENLLDPLQLPFLKVFRYICRCRFEQHSTIQQHKLHCCVFTLKFCLKGNRQSPRNCFENSAKSCKSSLICLVISEKSAFCVLA